MIRVREFVGDSLGRTDEKINEFLSNKAVKYVDVKYSYCENTSQTQGYALALLIYEIND